MLIDLQKLRWQRVWKLFLVHDVLQIAAAPTQKIASQEATLSVSLQSCFASSN